MLVSGASVVLGEAASSVSTAASCLCTLSGRQMCSGVSPSQAALALLCSQVPVTDSFSQSESFEQLALQTPQ
jgi:hypothetical protein